MDGSTAPERGGTRHAGTIGEWLRSVRRARFVGRDAELELFRDLVADPSPISALFVHGPGGVGKTTLLEQFAEIAEGAGLQVVRLDLGTIERWPRRPRCRPGCT